MFGYHHFQVTRDDDNSCTLAFSSILIEVFHPSYGFIVRIRHFFSDCELNNEMCARHQIVHPGLPVPFDAQLWPRHIQISLGNAVWKVTDLMISESRAGDSSWVYIAKNQKQE
jgi:hypothetical protein